MKDADKHRRRRPGGRSRLRALSARLKRAREALGLTQDEMALRCGISPRAWQDYEMGKTTPRAHVLACLCDEGFDANWLLAGSGAMRRERRAGAGAVAEARGGAEPRRGSDVAVPQVEDAVNVVLTLGHRAFLIQSLEIPPDSVSVYFVRGDAMEPILRDGEPVLVEQRAPEPVEGIYALHLRGTDSLIFRRVQQMPGGVYRASCERPTYEPFDFTLGDAVEVIGRVIWAGKRL